MSARPVKDPSAAAPFFYLFSNIILFPHKFFSVFGIYFSAADFPCSGDGIHPGIRRRGTYPLNGQTSLLFSGKNPLLFFTPFPSKFIQPLPAGGPVPV